MVESQTEETPLPGHRDSARARRSMFLNFMVSNNLRGVEHFIHSRNLKCDRTSNQFLCATWHERINVSRKNRLETC